RRLEERREREPEQERGRQHAPGPDRGAAAVLLGRELAFKRGPGEHPVDVARREARSARDQYAAGGERQAAARPAKGGPFPGNAARVQDAGQREADGRHEEREYHADEERD